MHRLWKDLIPIMKSILPNGNGFETKWKETHGDLYRSIVLVKEKTKGAEYARPFLYEIWEKEMSAHLDEERVEIGKLTVGLSSVEDSEAYFLLLPHVKLLQTYTDLWRDHVCSVQYLYNIFQMSGFRIPYVESEYNSKEVIYNRTCGVIPDLFTQSLELWNIILFTPLRSELISSLVLLLRFNTRRGDPTLSHFGALWFEIESVCRYTIQNFLLLPPDPHSLLSLPPELQSQPTLYILHQFVFPLFRADSRTMLQRLASKIYDYSGLTEFLKFTESLLNQQGNFPAICYNNSYVSGFCHQDPENQVEMFYDIYHLLVATLWNCCDEIKGIETNYNEAVSILVKIAVSTIEEVFITDYKDRILAETPQILSKVEEQLNSNPSLSNSSDSGNNFNLLEFSKQEIEAWQDLKRMWNLFLRISFHLPLQQLILSHVMENGSKIVSSFDSKVREKRSRIRPSPSSSSNPSSSSKFNPSSSTIPPSPAPNPGAIDAGEFVEPLVMLFRNYSCLSKEVNLPQWNKSIAEIFSQIVNKCTASPKYLAVYLDKQFLKTCSNGKLDELMVDKVFYLLYYLEQKDLFQYALRQDLSRRLLSDSNYVNTSMFDSEKSLIYRFKTQEGITFVRELEGMMKDIVTSSSITDQFHKFLEPATATAYESKEPDENQQQQLKGTKRQVTKRNSKAVNSIKLSVRILSWGCWPLINAAEQFKELILPQEVENIWAVFVAFYKNLTGGSRSLKFLRNLGNVEMTVKVNYRKEKAKVVKENMWVKCGVDIMTILCLFNEYEKLGVEDIKIATRMETKEIKTALYYLTCVKYNKFCKGFFLRRVADEKQEEQEEEEEKKRGKNEIKDEDQFECCLEQFETRTKKIKIESKMTVEQMDRKEKEEENQLKRQRNLVVDACIVRLMKARRKLHHSELVVSVTEQLKDKFKPQPRVIKERALHLIESDYLQRDPDDKNIYHYME